MHNSIRKYFVGNLVTAAPHSIHLQYAYGGGVALLRKPTISLKRGKIGPRLQLMTNGKSHTRFRLVPKSTTLDETEGITHCVSKHVRRSEPTSKI